MNTQSSRINGDRRDRKGSVLVVIVVVMAILALVVAGSIRPVRDEADLATLRVETTRAFYAAESGAFVVLNAVMSGADMPAADSSTVIEGQTIHYLQVPEFGSSAIVEGISGDAVRRIEFTAE